MKIAIGSDHAGFRYKEKIKDLLTRLGHEFHDFGTTSDKTVDYPLFIRPVAEAVASGTLDRGIVLGGSGNGEAIVANKIRGIRCTLCWNMETARLAREHNDANVLSLGARMIPEEEALRIVEIWLHTPFQGGRHLQRIKQIAQIEAVTQVKTPLDERLTKEEKAKNGKRSTAAQARTHDILIAFRYVKYFEGENELELQVDPGLKEPSIIHVPSAERWRSEMPPWARERREEILQRIRSKCAHMQVEWKEY